MTGLAEYARCPRRHWLATRMRIPEPPADGGGGDDPDRATVRGTLAHALLSEVDLAAPPLERRALLAAAASRRGEDPDRPGVRRIVEDVDRFLASRRRRRGLPGRPGKAPSAGSSRSSCGSTGEPACYLDGALDAP